MAPSYTESLRKTFCPLRVICWPSGALYETKPSRKSHRMNLVVLVYSITPKDIDVILPKWYNVIFILEGNQWHVVSCHLQSSFTENNFINTHAHTQTKDENITQISHMSLIFYNVVTLVYCCHFRSAVLYMTNHSLKITIYCLCAWWQWKHFTSLVRITPVADAIVTHTKMLLLNCSTSLKG